MPRILLVHPFAQAISGPDRSILTVMRRLIPEGYAYDVVLPGQSPFRAEYEALGCRVYTYPMSILKRRFDAAYLWSFAWRFLPTILRLRAIIRATGADLVHVNGGVIPGGGPAAVLAGRPAVTHIRCTAIDRPAIVGWGIALVAAATSRRVIGISRACADIVGGRVGRGFTRVVFNGIDLAPFREPADRDLWRRELDLPADAPVVGQVGRIGPDKGWRAFVQAAARIRAARPDAHFVCVGAPHQPSETAYLADVQGEAERLGVADAVHFVGQRDDIAAVMGGLDVFVTMAREEGLGRVAIEAMAAGRPVVANGVHGLREVVVHGETGALAAPNDPHDAAAHVVRLLEDADLRARLGDAGRQRAESVFSAAACAEATRAVYDEVLAETSRPRPTPPEPERETST